jgi:YbgC/YbaW family acyl-CoA thioester hydrolase
MFSTTRRVEFGDTDMAGIMHFANFFRFMEVAETEFLRARGLSVAWHDAGQRVGFPRVSASCDYVKPARFEDVLEIGVTLERIGSKSVTYRFDFTRGGEAIAVGRMSAVCCRSENGRIESVEIPPEVRAKLERP